MMETANIPSFSKEPMVLLPLSQYQKMEEALEGIEFDQSMQDFKEGEGKSLKQVTEELYDLD